MPCPIIGHFASRVLTYYENPGSHLNGDLLVLLEETLSKSQQEYPMRECLLRRSFRAFEFAYAAVYSDHISTLLDVPNSRASFETMPFMLEILSKTQDDVIVFDMEAKMNDEKITGRRQLEFTKKERIRLGAAVVIPCGKWILEMASTAILTDFFRIGDMLQDTSKYMAVGLTTQVKYAEELLRI
jgi:hypothetical protein